MLLLLFAVFLTLLIVGTDLFYAMGVSSLIYLLVLGAGPMPIPLTLIPQKLMSGVDSFPLLAVPMFLLAGDLMNRGGITARLLQFVTLIVGSFVGGLAHVAIVSNVIMAGISGSAVADAAATSSLLIPAMTKRGYPADFASAVIASAASIGPVIPPSIPMVIIGSLVSVSVGQLFLGGVVPGLLMALMMMVITYRYAHRVGLPVGARASLRDILPGVRDAALALLAPIVVLGSIVGGIATPTEASVVAVIYALLLGLVVYRELRLGDLPRIFARAGVASAVVMVTVGAAQVFGWITTAEGLGTLIGTTLTGISNEPAVILIIVNVVLLALGMFMEPIPVMILVVPILYPIVTQLGVDPVHFGVVVVLNLMIGALTPPIGLNLFVVSAISGVPVIRIAAAGWQFMVGLIVVLLLITYIPGLVTWLPQLLYGGP